MKEKTIEISRSYSQKVNIGNYQTKDYFCSARCECALIEVEKISEMLDDLVQNEVLKSIDCVKEDKVIETNNDIKPKEIQIP